MTDLLNVAGLILQVPLVKLGLLLICAAMVHDAVSERGVH